MSHVRAGWWWRELALFVISVVVVVVAFVSDPSQESIVLFGHEVPTLCVIKLATGYSCPGCGLTRAVTFTAHGQVIAGFMMHPLGPPMFLFFLVQLPFRLHRMIGGPSVTWGLRRRRGRRVGGGSDAHLDTTAGPELPAVGAQESVSKDERPGSSVGRAGD